MLSIFVVLAIAPGPNPARYAGWGAEVVDKMQHEFQTTNAAGFVDSATTRAGAVPKPASLESMSAVVSALTAAAAYDEKFVPLLRNAVESTARYWSQSPPVSGFSNFPLPDTSPRSYGANARMALALSQATTVLKSSESADSASNALAFTLSGLTKTGGILDHEGDPSYLTAFSGAAATLAALAQSNNSPSAQVVGLYEWVRKTFHDPESNLFKVSTTESDVDARDAAMVIECASFLFSATHEVKYGEQARSMEASTQRKWGTLDGPIMTSLPDSVQLVEAWFLRIRLAPRPRETFGASVEAFSALEWLHRNERDGNGHYGKSCHEPVRGKLESWRLEDQAMAARAFFVAASVAKAQAQN